MGRCLSALGRAEFLPYPQMAKALKNEGVVWRRNPLLKRLAYKVALRTRNDYEDPVYRAAVDRALLVKAGLSSGSIPERAALQLAS